MVLGSIEQLALLHGENPVSSRQVRDAIQEFYGANYPIQTIIVVLNRFTEKGTLTRCTLEGQQVRQRYGYYMAEPLASRRAVLLEERVRAIADEFCRGCLVQTLQELDSAARRLLQTQRSS